MAPQIEANSLSDITQLAGNPPKYPRNPTEQKRPPLTLYIARVPGSKDIILTTLKPQLKNVTSADIAASLYYLHLNSDEDAQLYLDEETSSPTKTDQRSLPRKPLPNSSASSYRNSFEGQPEALSTLLSQAGGPPMNTATNKPPQESKPLFRKPLGPRPLQTEASLRRKPLPTLSGAENKPLSPQPQVQNVRAAMSIEAHFDPSRSSFSNPVDETMKDFSITMIRRDPGSGGQWNIGTIVGHRIPPNRNEGMVKLDSSPRKSYYDISVHLDTPGYNYFREPPIGVNKSLDHQHPTSRPQSISSEHTLHDKSHTGFNRQVRMEWSSSWNEAFKSHRRTMSLEPPSNIGGKPSPAFTRELFSDNQDSAESGHSHPKGYTFSSPWGGTCRFSTTVGGRALSCKHTLPMPVSSSLSSTACRSSAEISEMRFNLPIQTVFDTAKFNAVAEKVAKKVSGKPISSPISPSKSPKSPGHATFSKLKQHFRSPSRGKDLPTTSQLHPTSYAAMYPDDDESSYPFPPTSASTSPPPPPLPPRRNSLFQSPAEEESLFDLSLGQEKAGGGNRGKRAKLGKLIVHNEGLKMLDLVVAANMGVWWSVWDPAI